jgi:hypothetical protein
MMGFEQEAVRARQQRLLDEAREHRLSAKGQAGEADGRAEPAATVPAAGDRKRWTSRWSWAGVLARATGRA